MMRLLFSIFLHLALPLFALAQQVVNSTGKVLTSPAMTVEYSVGEIAIQSLFASQASATQGFIQPNYILCAIQSNAGGDQSICAGDEAVLQGSGGGFYLWSTGGMTAQITVTPDTTTIFTLSVTEMGCTEVDTVVVQVKPLPAASISGDSVLCEEESTVLTLTTDGVFFLWNDNDNSHLQRYLTFQNQGSYIYSATVTAANGCTQTADKSITVHQRPDIQIDNASAICLGDTLVLKASGNGAVTYEWSTGSLFDITEVSPQTTTTYRLIGISNLGCRDTAFAAVPVRYLPVANAGEDQVACLDSARLQGILPVGGIGEWMPLGSAFVEIPDSSLTAVLDLATGENFFQWRVATPPCPGEAFDTVVLYFANQIPVLAADDTLTLEGKPVNIYLLSNDSLSALPGFSAMLTETDNHGEWTLLPTGWLEFEPGYQFTGTAKAKYVICNEQCPDFCVEADIQILVRQPNDDSGETQVITPNGDGKNDQLTFDYLSEFPENSIVIFNRWGDVVFKAKPYLNDWSGEYGSGILPAGTYYYVLNLKGDDNLIWGNTLLIR